MFKYKTSISVIDRTIPLQELIVNSTAAQQVAFGKEFELLTTVHKNHLKLRYKWTGKLNVILLQLKKQDQTIVLEVREGILGFVLPMAFSIGGLLFYFQLENNHAALLALGCAVVSVAYVYSAFYSYAKEVEKYRLTKKRFAYPADGMIHCIIPSDPDFVGSNAHSNP